MTHHTFRLEEAKISEMQAAMESGLLTSVELTTLYLNRIYYYDHNGLKLNSVPLINTDALFQAAHMDELRKKGTVLGPLHGIPFTVKDSYMVKGMTVANGSPALAHLVAKDDSFIVSALKSAGGVLIGKTNMPPMAAGGMQCGVYGRAESPYNSDFLPSAWFSGSSNGSGTSTAANFAAFGMAEETVSSGRSPASNNGLVAYTPSRGLLSIRGNWPLFPTRDVVVPHTRCMDDLLILLNVIMQDDPITSCDFWRMQNVVELPTCSEFRPTNFCELKLQGALKGKRIGVPKMYIGCDNENEQPIIIRPSIKNLWQRAENDLKKLGAEIIKVEFPLMKLYQQDFIFLKPFVDEGLLPDGWMEQEWNKLAPYAIEEFLHYINDVNYPTWKDIDPDTVFPNPPGSVDELRKNDNARYRECIEEIKAGIQPLTSLPNFKEALLALENIRKVYFENWLCENKLDILAFPANCDIASSNADHNEDAYDHAWQNGNFFSNTNHMLRHLGIPSVSVCMGIMEDTHMPVNITLIGPAYSDKELMAYAYDYEQATLYREAPARTHALLGEEKSKNILQLTKPEQQQTLDAELNIEYADFVGAHLVVSGTCRSEFELQLFINGSVIDVSRDENIWLAKKHVGVIYSVGRNRPRELNIIALAKCMNYSCFTSEKTIKIKN
jgi:amidase